MGETDKEFVLVTEYFHPDTASTGQLMTDLAVGLEERGLDMTVYTGQPNYHSGENKKQPRVSTHEGVLIKRIQAPQVRQSGLPRRLFNWTVFTAWMFFTLLFSRSDQEREIIFVSNPPFLPIAMWLVCRIRGWEYTYIVYDVYPEMAIAPGHINEGGVVDKLWSRLHKSVFLRAKHIVALGPTMKDLIINKSGEQIDESKIQIIHNWEDPDFIKPREKEDNWFSQEHGLVEPFTILYSGNIGDNHDLETVVRAAAELSEENVEFVIIGEGDKKDEIVDLASQLDIIGTSIKFLPYQDFEDLPYSLTSGDVSIVSVSEGMKGVCVSSKLYTSFAAGQPVLVISHPEDDEARIVSKFDAGVQVTQNDIQGIVAAVEEWIENPKLVEKQGANARKAFETRFTKQNSINEYFALLLGDQ
ncbi:Glycosyltransferase involved in cell wall bisynthesis [Halovenus aranensis]|uniref:Glycosyltransferase involved in cell wall bisynthesis n=1 Tax=Halovenus aranensis TaxID=890420 RepID=A0A1G8ZKK2_9EURY|nr:glycosyltransferase family 4 protein [Halovenus aranensis]SDK15553.1 Glycosyltransferase involved in cell wall bisynthesis [Halovenus aranensis]